MDTNVTPLTDAERAWVREQLAATTRFVADYGSVRPTEIEAVEHAWASWLDRQNVDPEDPNPVLNAVGIYFGQSLVDALDGFDWVTTSDEENSSSFETALACAFLATSGSRFWLQATTFMPNARPMSATLRPW